MTHELIDTLGAALEVAGVALLIGGLLLAFARSARQGHERFLRLRHDIGRAILLGLEVLVAADIVRSVTLAPTMDGLTVLATLVVIRTFLSWSLALELDGRWPWQRHATTPAPPLETTP
jgi:uncharacterized membrane protein